MRFRRRPDAPPEPEPDETAWARPTGEAEEAAEEPPAAEDAPAPAWDPVDDTPTDDFVPEHAGVDAPAAPDEPERILDEPDQIFREPEVAVPEVVPEAVVPEAVVPERPVVPETLPPVVPPPVARPPVAPSPARQRRWSGGRDSAPTVAEGTVRAAGGVVWTRWRGGLRVVVVHRPRYDDWSLPKGKAGPGETDDECALREVREETGLSCSLGEELGMARYHDRHGRPKVVRYFAMQPLGGGQGPQHEVDEVRWLPIDDARRILTYARDAEMLDALAVMAARAEGTGEADADWAHPTE